eukprot:3590173-Pyramimonas_sp.AAC.1
MRVHHMTKSNTAPAAYTVERSGGRGAPRTCTKGFVTLPSLCSSGSRRILSPFLIQGSVAATTGAILHPLMALESAYA